MTADDIFGIILVALAAAGSLCLVGYYLACVGEGLTRLFDLGTSPVTLPRRD